MSRRLLLSACLAVPLLLQAQVPELSRRNPEVPFCYQCGASRSWPVVPGALPEGTAVELAAGRNGSVLQRGKGDMEFEGLRISLGRDGKLVVASARSGDRAAFDLTVTLRAGSQSSSQTLTIRPAPPVRPVTYYADFGDDVINIFGTGVFQGQSPLHHQLREGGKPERKPAVRDAQGRIQYDKAGFDQYFRRLQCQGVDREILWLFPFPFVTDASVYDQKDWDLYRCQSQALVEDAGLTRILAATQGQNSWAWIRDLATFRFDPKMHRALSDSAIEHGITLGVSYRPFEHAASKYYQLPVFDESGEFLWMFQPLSSPAVNFRAAEIGFAQSREILAAMGKDSEVTEIHIPGAENTEVFLARFREKRDNLRIAAASFPPVQTDSLVLVRRADGGFRLLPYRDVQQKAEARRYLVRDFEVHHEPGKGIRLTGFRIPNQYAYLVLENPSGAAPLTLTSVPGVRLLTANGAELGRHTTYLAFPEDTKERKKTRIAGITPDGGMNAIFFAAEASSEILYAGTAPPVLDTAALVVYRGEPYSGEMVDFQLPAARANVLRELHGVLKYPAFREIYVNTRSHTSLAAALGDGDEGIRPIMHYRGAKRRYSHLGVDLGYAPRSAAKTMRQAPEKMAVSQPGEWAGTCQSEDCRYPWRLARNRAVGAGVRALLEDVSREFPNTRLRLVLPEREAVVQRLRDVQEGLPAGSVPYTSSRNNYIQNIGEGLAFVDLAGLEVEPVLLGVGPFVAPPALGAFLKEATADMAGNRGSRLHGPLGMMYEGQWTLKDAEGHKAREDRMCRMLAHPGIGEVIVYEAADWAYRLPWDGFDFLGRCGH